MRIERRQLPAPEPKPVTTPEEPERRSFVFVFDALGASTALRMNQAKHAASKFARTHLRPDDLGAVYQLDMYAASRFGRDVERR